MPDRPDFADRHALNRRERLQPSLLDRLTDNAPTETRDSPDTQVLTLKQLRLAVLRDLSWLFNTTHLGAIDDLARFPTAAGSTLNFGIPSLAGMIESGMKTAELERRLADVIKTYEPRIRPETLRVRARAIEGAMPALVMEITGELWAQPVPIPLFLETRVDVETRLAVIRDMKAEG